MCANLYLQIVRPGFQHAGNIPTIRLPRMRCEFLPVHLDPRIVVHLADFEIHMLAGTGGGRREPRAISRRAREVRRSHVLPRFQRRDDLFPIKLNSPIAVEFGEQSNPM